MPALLLHVRGLLLRWLRLYARKLCAEIDPQRSICWEAAIIAFRSSSHEDLVNWCCGGCGVFSFIQNDWTIEIFDSLKCSSDFKRLFHICPGTVAITMRIENIFILVVMLPLVKSRPAIDFCHDRRILLTLNAADIEHTVKYNVV